MNDLKINCYECAVCDKALTGRQRLFCSEACKQAAKYEQAKGLRCKVCKKTMKPRPTMGGFIQMHKRCEGKV